MNGLAIVDVLRNIQEVLHWDISLAILKCLDFTIGRRFFDDHNIGSGFHDNYFRWWRRRGHTTAPKAKPTTSVQNN